MLLGSEAFIVRCSELNVFSKMNAWACQYISTLVQKTYTDESADQSVGTVNIVECRQDQCKTSPETDKPSTWEQLVAWLVRHAATGEAQASLRLMKAPGNKLQAGGDRSQQHQCRQHPDMPSRFY